MNVNLVLPLLFFGVANHTSMLMAQSPGTFTGTGNLTTPRQFHTATLLTNGRVLVTGGYDTPDSIHWRVWASAELYDPSTGTFTATGDMTTARFSHTATLLPNGKILIAGGGPLGSDFALSVAQAELYDPFTGTFTATGEMTAARSWHTATLLNDGKVLIVGGSSRGNPRQASAELYDPFTGTFTATGGMMTGRSSHTATLLGNGKVLIEGNGGPDVRAELYDPDTGTFSLTGGMTAPYAVDSTATLPSNGKVLVTLEDSSCDNPGDLASVYDPSTGTYAATGTMTITRSYSTATLLPDGRVLIGGREYWHFASAELYDPAKRTFGTTADLIMHRQEGHTATLLPDGTVLMAGGWLCCGYSIATAEIYHPAVLVSSPVLFSLSRDGQGLAAILHSATHQIVSSSNPAIAGESLEIYLTGLMDGSVIPPQVAIDGRMAEVLFFGKAPGFEGLNQVNVRVPSGISEAPAAGVRLTYIGRSSNEVTIAVR